MVKGSLRRGGGFVEAGIDTVLGAKSGGTGID
jgi:hypothetical protein